MAVSATTDRSPPTDDPILPILKNIRFFYDQYLRDPIRAGPHLIKQIGRCIKFLSEPRYRDDERLLKIMIIYADVTKEFVKAYNFLEKYEVCQDRALFYETYAMFHIQERNLMEANNLYKKGIERNAQPSENMRKSYEMFLKHVHQIARKKTQSTEEGISLMRHEKSVDPYSPVVLKEIIDEIKRRNLNGYFWKERVDALHLISANNSIKLGDVNYQIEGFTNEGGYAKVYKANIADDTSVVYAFKVEKAKPFVGPLEYYMYRQLDNLIAYNKRPSFGVARGLHVFNDCNILICDYLSSGTLWEAIWSYTANGTEMGELLCMYYTIEMLDMLEALHGARLIHGDFKPDNMLVRNSSDKLTIKGFRDRSGPWRHEGLCLVDWGKGIDLRFFLSDVEFNGDDATENFACTEMRNGSPWIFQADSYALCVCVHFMMHQDFIKLEVFYNAEDNCDYFHPQTKGIKSGWNFELWGNLFKSLLRLGCNESDVTLLRGLKNDFQDYICSETKRIKELVDQLAEGNQQLSEYKEYLAKRAPKEYSDEK